MATQSPQQSPDSPNSATPYSQSRIPSQRPHSPATAAPSTQEPHPKSTHPKSTHSSPHQDIRSPFERIAPLSPGQSGSQQKPFRPTPTSSLRHSQRPPCRSRPKSPPTQNYFLTPDPSQ